MRSLRLLGVATAMLMLPAALCRAETLTVVQRSIADEKAVFSTVESISVVPARSRIGGTVAQLHVREGDAVTRGQGSRSSGTKSSRCR